MRGSIVLSCRKAVSSGIVTKFAFMKTIATVNVRQEGIPNVRTQNECVASARPISDALYVLSGKWKLPLIFMLRHKSQRFTEILRMVDGLTPKVLIKELRELEMNGFVIRHVERGHPDLITYVATSYSDSLEKVLGELYAWGDQHRENIRESMRSNTAK